MDRERRERRDREEIKRFLAGDENAFARLIAAYQDNIHQFACSLLGLAEAEDTAQEVFLQAFRSLPNFRGDSSFSTWLYSLARNVCRHRLRSMSAARRAGERADMVEAADMPDGEPGLLARLESEESRALVRQAVDSLSCGHCAVLVLCHWEGLRYEEIARVLDIPVGTVKSRVHNAVAALAQRLTERLRRVEER